MGTQRPGALPNRAHWLVHSRLAIGAFMTSQDRTDFAPAAKEALLTFRDPAAKPQESSRALVSAISRVVTGLRNVAIQDLTPRLYAVPRVSDLLSGDLTPHRPVPFRSSPTCPPGKLSIRHQSREQPPSSTPTQCTRSSLDVSCARGRRASRSC